MPFDSNITPTVVLLVDVDCFEVQLWQKKFRPKPTNGPTVTANESGMMTSVNNEAKKAGVKRGHMSLKQARQICPNLDVITIPNRYGKPDTREPRLASYKLYDAVKEFCDHLRKVVVRYDSKDEFFIDITKEVAHRLSKGQRVPSYQEVRELPDRTILNHHHYRLPKSQEKFSYRVHQVLGKSTRTDHILEAGLMHGAVIANQLIKHLKKETGFQCSAGVGHNKLTAKLACGMNKPAGITIMPLHGVTRASKYIFIPTIPGLGGHIGNVIMNVFKIRTMYDLSLIPVDQLMNMREIGAQGPYFHALSIGIDCFPVEAKTMSKDITCGKSFKGKRRIEAQGDILKHLYLLCEEMMERLEEEVDRNSRAPVAFRLEIKGCKPNGRRDINLNTLFGESFNVQPENDLKTSDLYEKLKILFSSNNGKNIEKEPGNIVGLNIIAKFPSDT